MKKLRYFLLYGAAMSILLGIAGCTTDQAPTSAVSPGNTAAPDEQTITIFIDQGTAAEETYATQQVSSSILTCFPAPTVSCVRSTDSSITVRVCVGPLGAPEGFAFQWYRVPEGTPCNAFAFPASGVPTVVLSSGIGQLPPNSCILLTLRRVACESTYAFRAKVLGSSSYCASPFSAKVCCSSLDCGEQNPPCLTAPSIQCIASTDSTLTIRVVAGAAGTPGGIILQRTVLPGASVCSTFAWPATGVRSDTLTASVYRLPPFYARYITLRTGIECNTTYALRVKAKATSTECASDFSKNTCCSTQGCEQGPGDCYDEPTVTCIGSTDSTITLRVCAGPSGAPAGIVLQYARLPMGVSCGNYTWAPSTASLSNAQDVESIDALSCVNVTLRYVPCGSTYVFRARAKASSTRCGSDYTANVCCSSGSCG